MKNILSNTNIRIIRVAFVSLIISLLFVFFMDFDLLKSMYQLYYGESEIVDFFEEQQQNVFTNGVRVTVFRLIVFRFIYSVLPIVVGLFLMAFYHSKALPQKYTKSELFVKNPSLGSIINISRYLLGFVLFLCVLNYNRQFYNSTFHNCLIGNVSDFLRIFLAVILFLIPVLEWTKLKNDLKSFPKRHKKLTCFAFIILISIISFCLIEFQIGSKTMVFVYLIHVNVMYWIIIQLVFLALFRSVKPGAVISLVFSYVIGLANDIVYQFRGNYIMFGDITVVRTALEVAGNYEYHPNKWFWISAILLVVSIVFVLYVKISPKAFGSHNLIGRVFSTILIEGIIAIFVIISFRTGDFYGKVFGVGWNYNENVTFVGYLPYFFSNMDSTTRVVVDGYSPEEVDGILSKYSAKKNDGKKINIILIQNEAFSDISITADIETDKDYMPYIHSMKDNTQKGFMNMSVTGGPTSNTEFEVLTRCSLQYFPYGSVPYTQYLKQNTIEIYKVRVHYKEDIEYPFHGSIVFEV